ncbi:MAG: NPCBM/NEW2 domain-containing protein, partial [Clostridium sp.]
GIGVATNSEIVYNLDGKGYDYFTTYLGTDKNYGDNRTSIDFIILADGEEVYRSSTIKRDSLAEFVKLDISGVKELKLIADNHEGNGLGDFASWADTKFYTNNTKPTLNVNTETQYVKYQDVFNIMENVNATDIEDGDITDKITVNTNGFDTSTPGEYNIAYTIKDSDGNEVNKTKKILVYNEMEYASDVEWESATTGWKTVNKDKAVGSENKIKLNVNGEVKEFNKGIGVATNSEIVYNLEGKDFGYFTTYLGTDKNYDDKRTSIDFIIEVDGVQVYKSNTIKRNSEAEFVEINLVGAKEIKLTANDHDGNLLGDFASWADTKFYTVKEMVDLTQEVEIEDSVLKNDIKKELKLDGDKITIGDMQNLKKLEGSGYVKSLKGLEHAKNLENLNINYNEVSDISPLKNLKNLKDFTGLENFLMKPSVDAKDNKYIIEYLVIDINGERILPTEIVLDPRTNPVKVNVEEVMQGNEIILNKDLINGAKTVEILYESKVNNYQLYTMYFIN